MNFYNFLLKTADNLRMLLYLSTKYTILKKALIQLRTDHMKTCRAPPLSYKIHSTFYRQ